MGIVQSLLWHYATRGRRLVDPGLDRHTVRYVYFRSLSLSAVFAISIPLGFLSPTWAIASWLLIAPALRITRGYLKRRMAAEGAPWR
ncbi:MAG TPA: hypothetical protein VMS93_06755 [Candidatus Saccharimonadales bacterium]|nr:hypothetical protein [Candidatus Saccharimonadales bacterium]